MLRVSGLDLQELCGKVIVPGDDVWNKDRLADEFRSSLHLLHNQRPVLSPIFRQKEAERLLPILAEAEDGLFNMPLIRALHTNCPILFLSDCPAQSLGIALDTAAVELSEVFWEELSRRLLPGGQAFSSQPINPRPSC